MHDKNEGLRHSDEKLFFIRARHQFRAIRAELDFRGLYIYRER